MEENERDREMEGGDEVSFVRGDANRAWPSFLHIWPHKWMVGALYSVLTEALSTNFQLISAHIATSELR
jgi:hypothetical protein